MCLARNDNREVGLGCRVPVLRCEALFLVSVVLDTEFSAECRF